MKSAVRTDAAPQPIGPYSQAIKASGSFIFVSGQIPFTPGGDLCEGGIVEQTKQCIENLIAVLGAGGFSIENVVKTTVFLKDMNDFASMNEVYNSYFESSKPARSAVQVCRLPKDVMVEIEAIAVKD